MSHVKYAQINNVCWTVDLGQNFRFKLEHLSEFITFRMESVNLISSIKQYRNRLQSSTNKFYQCFELKLTINNIA